MWYLHARAVGQESLQLIRLPLGINRASIAFGCTSDVLLLDCGRVSMSACAGWYGSKTIYSSL